jgi:hypothetical protein
VLEASAVLSDFARATLDMPLRANRYRALFIIHALAWF